VPFFIRGGTALATGRGEILRPVEVHNPLHILVVHPHIRVSTAWAYNQLNLDLTSIPKSVNLIFSNFDFAAGARDSFSSLINHFESVLLPLYPVIRQIKESMYEADAVYASMSGSGSTVYGLFSRREDAEDLAKRFEGAYQSFLANHIHWGYGQM
jgi:4-diphosphocytidyl-2-C-methyl-D-erythritol kinase